MLAEMSGADVNPGRARVRSMNLQVGLLIATDGLIAAAAIGVGLAVALRRDDADPAWSVLLALVVLFAWVALLAWSKPLAVPMLRKGSAEFRHMLLSTFAVFGGAAVVFAFHQNPLLYRLVTVSMPIAVVGVVLNRLLWRRRSSAGAQSSHSPTLVVGGYYSARATAAALLRGTPSGTLVVGACIPAHDAEEHDFIDVGDHRVPVVGTDQGILAAIEETGARVVALTATDSLGPGDLRALIWELEERDVELVVTPGVVDIAGHRIVHASLGDMPMMHIARPQHMRADSVAKRLFDIAFAAAALLATSPVLAVAAIAVRVTSPGPVFYPSERVGEDGRTFVMHKFRSMYVDADQRVDQLKESNEAAGVLFKMKDDPRVTRAGKVLRRYSIDELPQFYDVLRGEMSVVGPRPALRREVNQYPVAMRRRLLVKPGVTGAWQVNGRSDLSWNESIRLDVGYVENWSLMRDLLIVLKTARAVLGKDGAY